MKEQTEDLQRGYEWARERLAALGPRLRAALVLATVVLIAGPVALTLARQDDYEASQQVFPVDVGPVVAPDIDWTRQTVAEQPLQTAIADAAGLGDVADPIDGIEARQLPDKTVFIEITAATPDRVHSLLEALGPQLQSVSASQVQATLTARVDQIDSQLDSDQTLSPSERAALKSERSKDQKLIEQPSARYLLGRVPPPPAITNSVDKLVNKLPGEMPVVPSLLMVALAGALVALAMWAVALVRARPGQ